jgi:transcriptional regulator with XRE-family HTH domain
MDDLFPANQAGRIMRALRAHVGLSQRELAARANLSESTVARAEGARGRPPSWTTIVRVAEACECFPWVATDDLSPKFVRVWPFDDVIDKGNRHLPAHLEAWQLERASEWSSFLKYICYADPPFPEFSYVMRRNRSVAKITTAQTGLDEQGQTRPTYPS